MDDFAEGVDAGGDDGETFYPYGFIPDWNLPGSSQGEYNGLYASPTQNVMNPGGYSYLAANPGTRTDLLSGIRSLLEGTSGVVQSVGGVQRQVAQANRQAALAAKPTLMEQWAALSAFEKFGFFAAVLGIAWSFNHK